MFQGFRPVQVSTRRAEYRLTGVGLEFREAILPLIRWEAHRDGWDAGRCPSCGHDHSKEGLGLNRLMKKNMNSDIGVFKITI